MRFMNNRTHFAGALTKTCGHVAIDGNISSRQALQKIVEKYLADENNICFGDDHRNSSRRKSSKLANTIQI